jgi:hypothetical protein
VACWTHDAGAAAGWITTASSPAIELGAEATANAAHAPGTLQLSRA